MADESELKAPAAPRLVEAMHGRDQKPVGSIEILGSTKHGKTTLIGVKDDDVLKPGDTLKTKVWLLNAREFIILRRHEKPMKMAGVWYEVRTVATSAAKPKR